MVSLADLATLGGRELSYRYELGVCGDHEFTVEKPCRPARSPGPGAWPAGAPPPPRTAATGTRTTTGIASRPRSRNPGTSTISRASTARSPASPANRTRPATQRDDGALREPRRRTTTSGNEQDPRSHPPPASAEPGTCRLVSEILGPTRPIWLENQAWFMASGRPPWSVSSAHSWRS